MFRRKQKKQISLDWSKNKIRTLKRRAKEEGFRSISEYLEYCFEQYEIDYFPHKSPGKDWQGLADRKKAENHICSQCAREIAGWHDPDGKIDLGKYKKLDIDTDFSPMGSILESTPYNHLIIPKEEEK